MRQWVLVAIIGLICAQSFLGYLLYFSFESPDKFGQSYTATGKRLGIIHQKTKENLLGLLDYGQNPMQKKQTTTSQIAISFNLFLEKYGICIPECQEYYLNNRSLFFYNITYSHLFNGEIPHPPQIV